MRSLLMLGGDKSGDIHDTQNVVDLDAMADADKVRAHRLARSRRRGTKPNIFLSALGDKQAEAEPHAEPHADTQDEAIAAIESDVEALMRQVEQHSPFNTAPEGASTSAELEPHSSGSYPSDPYRPLLDPSILLGAVWRWRFPILASTMLGGLVGAFIALGTPTKYTAYSDVFVDPRAISLVDRDLSRDFLANEAALAIVDSQLAAVRSTPVLTRAIEGLNLYQDPEFNGQSNDGIGLFDGIAFVRSLFSSELPVDVSERVTLETLRRAVDADRSSRTFVFSISAESVSPRKAADIANAVTAAFIAVQNEKKANAARTASNTIDGQLGELQAAVQSAEERAEAFAQANNLARIEGQTISDQTLVATSAQLSEAKAATIAAKSLADSVRSISVEDVIVGGLPSNLVTPALTTFRAQFSSLSQSAASLEESLGPRHPRLANAIASREAARDEIRAELNRIIAGTQADLRRTIQNEQEIAAALARARVDVGQSGDALIQLRALEAEIEAAREVYRTALLRSRETDQLSNVASINATVFEPAAPPLSPSSISRSFIAAGGAGLGAILGIGLALLFGVRDCLRQMPGAPAPRHDPTPRRPRNGSGGGGSAEPALETQNKSETDMYPGAPYYPYVPHPAQPLQAAPVAHTPMHVQPIYPQPTPQPYYPAQAAPAYAPYPVPMPPQPQVMMPQQMAQPAYQPMPEPQPAPMTAPARWEAQSAEHEEMEELRESLKDLRDVVDHLAQRRSTRAQFG